MGSKKKVAKKKAAKKAKRSSKKVVSQELVIRVQNQPTLPTIKDIAEPMHDGKKLSIAKTWVSEGQIMKMVQKTPAQHIYTRPGKGGKEFTYVTGNYVEKVLNFVFGFLWDFEIINHGKEGDVIWVQGKLTVKNPNGDTISKSQFGRAEIKFKKDTKIMLDYGNDLKAASTDALKKCASLLGIAGDIYGKQEFKQEANVDVQDTPPVVHTPVKIDGPVAPKSDHLTKCSKCGAKITQAEENYSIKIYKKALCRKCQGELKQK